MESFTLHCSFKRLKVMFLILRSFLPWHRFRSKPNPRTLTIPAQRQWTSYSCTAAVAQMVARYYGHRLGHRAAIQLTRCRPDGASLGFVARAMKKTYGLKHQSLRGCGQIRRALAQKKPVISHDSLSYQNDHAILVVGATPKGFWIADPAVGQIYWRHQRVFFAGAEEFIAIAAAN